MPTTACIEEAANLLELNSAFEQSLVPFGFEAFAGGTIRDGHRPASMFLRRWPRKWVEEYIANGYAADDPIVPEAIRSEKPFSADDLDLPPDDKGSRILKAAKRFGWRSTIVVPMHGPAAHRGLVCVASLALQKTALTDSSLIGLCNVAYRRGLKLSRQIDFRISPKETNALSLASSGMNDEEIAGAMSISKNTAHRHIESAKKKLGAKSRAQAIGIAVTYGLI